MSVDWVQNKRADVPDAIARLFIFKQQALFSIA
jgi:hypothetical protein